VLGENGANIARIVKILAGVVKTDFLNRELQERISVLLKQIFSQMSAEVGQALISSLTEEEQGKLQFALA
jgi:translation initiation factor RLI1